MKKIYLISLFSIFSLNLFCQIHWTKHPDNPDNGPWISWGMGRGNYWSWFYYLSSIAHIICGTGLIILLIRICVSVTPRPLMDSLGRRIRLIIWDCIRVRVELGMIIGFTIPRYYSEIPFSICGTLVILSAQIDNKDYRIGHATSPDGINWTKDANNPVLDLGPTGYWDNGLVIGIHCSL